MSTKIVVCGTGNAAHVVAGLAASNPEMDIHVLARQKKKADLWNSIREVEALRVVKREHDQDCIVARTDRLVITNDPESAMLNCDMVILAVPAFAHSFFLGLIAPYIGEGVVIVGFPGQGGFEFEVNQFLRQKHPIIMNFESSPWSCRINDFGREVCILGAKKMLVGAIRGNGSISRVSQPFQIIQELFGQWTEIIPSKSLLGITLMSINAYSHPPIMYGAWKEWDGGPLAEPPLFYHSISRPTAELLTEVTEEGQMISQKIMEQFPGEDLSNFVTMKEWDLMRYGHLIEDKTDQFSVLRTNRAYAKIRHPTKLTNRGCVPDFEHRFLSEDVPYGLMPIRGMAELVGVATPRIDEILTWSQARLGKEYLIENRLIGKDLISTRAPQRYGCKKLEEVL